MAIGHTRRLCARFIREATQAPSTGHHDQNDDVIKIHHATKLELACIRTWIHEESPRKYHIASHLHTTNKLDLNDVVVKVRGGNPNISQQPSKAAENVINDSETSQDESKSEEISEPKNDWPLENNGKKLNKKTLGTTVPKHPKKQSNSNQSTPKATRKRNENDRILSFLEEFVKEINIMSQGVNEATSTWEKNKSTSLGKKTITNLEILRTDMTEKMADINETWDDVDHNSEGSDATKGALSETTKSALSQAVRGAKKTTNQAIHQIEEFLQEGGGQRTTPIKNLWIGIEPGGIRKVT